MSLCYSTGDGVDLHFNVSRLLREPSGASRSYVVDDLPLAGAAPATESVSGKVRLLKTDKGVWVSASLESHMACTCSRCLVGYAQLVGIAIEEEFFPRSVALPHGLEVSEENLGIDENNILDLTETVHQYLLIGAPYRRLCSDDCRGICAGCGGDMNMDQCRCERTGGNDLRDNQWGGLLELARHGQPGKAALS